MLFRTLPVTSFLIVAISIAPSVAAPGPDYYRSQTLTRRSYDQLWRRDVAPPVLTNKPAVNTPTVNTTAAVNKTANTTAAVNTTANTTAAVNTTANITAAVNTTVNTTAAVNTTVPVAQHAINSTNPALNSTSLALNSTSAVKPALKSTLISVTATKPAVNPAVNSTTLVTAAKPAVIPATDPSKDPFGDPAMYQMFRAYYHQQRAERHLHEAKKFQLIASRLAAMGDEEGAEKMSELSLHEVEKAKYHARKGMQHTNLLDAITGGNSS